MVKKKTVQSVKVSETGNKSGDRIQIINILAATSIALMTILVGLSNEKLSHWMIVQLSFSIPCYITSSLSYSKLSYRKLEEIVIWDRFAWLTFSTGYGLMLNSIALLLYFRSKSLGFWFVGIATVLFVIYSLIDIFLDRKRVGEKIYKLAFYLIIIIIGFLLPVYGSLL